MTLPPDAETLIRRATETPGAVSYMDLYLDPTFQKLKEDDSSAHLVRLLHLFAQGTWQDYAQAAEGTYPKLSEAQEEQLRRLSLVSLSHTSRCLPYDHIGAALGLAQDALTIEQLVLDAMDLGMLHGRLDGVNHVFHVSTTSGRDVLRLPEGEAAMSSLYAALSTWKDDAAQVLQSLDKEIQQVSQTTDASMRQSEARHQALVDALQGARRLLGLEASTDEEASMPAPWTTRRGKCSRI